MVGHATDNNFVDHSRQLFSKHFTFARDASSSWRTARIREQPESEIKCRRKNGGLSVGVLLPCSCPERVDALNDALEYPPAVHKPALFVPAWLVDANAWLEVAYELIPMGEGTIGHFQQGLCLFKN